MLSQEKEKKEIIKVLDNLDKFIVKGTVKKGRGRNKEYDEITILKLLVLLTLAKISYRGAKGFLEGNGEYIEYLMLIEVSGERNELRMGRGNP